MYSITLLAMLIKRVKKEKRVRRKLQDQMGITSPDDVKVTTNSDNVSVTSQEDSDKNANGSYRFHLLFIIEF